MTDLLSCDAEIFNLCLSIWLHLNVFHEVYSLPKISFNQFFCFSMIVSEMSESSPSEFKSSQSFLSRIGQSMLRIILEDYSESSSEASDDISDDEDNLVDVFRSVFKTFDISADTVSRTTWLEVTMMVFRTMLAESEVLKFNPFIREITNAYQEYSSQSLQPKGKSLLYILYSLCEMAMESSGVNDGITNQLNQRKECIHEYLSLKGQEKKEKLEIQTNPETINPNSPLTLTQSSYIHSLSQSLQEGNIQRCHVEIINILITQTLLKQARSHQLQNHQAIHELKQKIKQYEEKQRIDKETVKKMIHLIKDSTNMRGSVIPLGMDRYGNTFYLFPFDYNYLYMRTSDTILHRMKEIASKSPLLQSMNLVHSQMESDYSLYIKRYESGLLSGNGLCGWFRDDM